MTQENGPLLVELTGSTKETEQASPYETDPIPDVGGVPANAMVNEARGARFFGYVLSAVFGILGLFVSIWLWDFTTALFQRHVVLGWIALTLVSVLGVAFVIWVIKELRAIMRLRRLDQLQKRAQSALSLSSMDEARAVTAALEALYKGRAELDWGRANLKEALADQFEPEAVLALAERDLLLRLDKQAAAAIELAARRVATLTTMVPLPWLDVLGAFFINLRLLRQLGEIYGGRSGFWGSWRLMRAVFAHLVATGMIAVGDDTLGSLIGGGLLAKLSRRFGEGLVNGILTARVGLAAQEVCRPLPYIHASRPSVSGTVRRAIGGLAGTKE
jgi:putative membrane protein